MKNVLIVSYVFPPLVAGGSARLGQFAKYLPHFAWVPTVLTGAHRGAAAVDHSAVAALPKEVTLVEARCPDVGGSVGRRGQVHPQLGLSGSARSALRRLSKTVFFPDRQIVWIPDALRQGMRVLAARPHDAILASYPPASSIVVGYLLAKRSGLPLAVDFRDLWSDFPVDLFATPVHRRLAKRIERRVVQRAARVAAVTEAMAEHLALCHGRERDDVVAIPNGFDPDDLEVVSDRRSESDRPFRLAYTGSANIYHDFDALWRVVARLKDEGLISPASFRLEFVGNLSLDKPRRFRIDEFIETRPFVVHREVFDVFSRADALLLMEDPGYYRNYSYAAKAFDYVLTGKPVLALIPQGGNSHRLLSDVGVGYCAEPTDEHAIREQLLRVLAKKGEPPLPVRINAPPLQAFNRQFLTARLANMLDSITEK
jgi:glycosyltransferase involved in cell wall biosynthesis